MTTRPYELLARFANDGSVAGVSVRTITTVNGRDFEGDPQPLSGASDPAFTAFASAFSAAIVAERDALKPIADLSEQRAARIAELEAELDAIRNPPGPDLSTVEGVKQLLSQVRYEREVTGFTVGDQFVSTNRDELAHWFARFFDAFNFLQGVASASNGLYPYKPRGGNVVTILTAQQAVRAYQCLAWYVNACIATEGELIAAIDAGQLTLQQAVAAINNEGTWPQRQFAWVAE